MSGIAVPIAIVLIGAFIIFGVTKMLSSGKNHRDLIDEMNSKTFGNRWVAAYELSKFLAAQKIPKEDMPWVIENLSKVYFESVDPRTRNFVVLALGSLNNPLTLSVLNKALEDQDAPTRFNATVSLGNMTPDSGIEWNKIENNLNQENDIGLRQASFLTIASHHRPNTQEKALIVLKSSEKSLQYSAATVLISFKNREAIPALQEILNLTYDVAKAGFFNGAQVEGLKMNVLENLEKSKWNEMASMVKKVEETDPNIRVSTKAKLVSKILKN